MSHTSLIFKSEEKLRNKYGYKRHKKAEKTIYKNSEEVDKRKSFNTKVGENMKEQ